ncbi:two-component system, NtrC family, nitrogen regulation response regulator GlnG/two-component system, NtrC family, response regulator HydG [Chitinophaga sp. CF118]|uniref:sigma-54-dependent transcriptional regulator n=1 Tax=Chitinophaga sp. CF118 TaxID=1884367 RepID=UPI0008F3936F|nr:sigma-54 dependent transcriptional regulator [Chitinophaga sp. CF118]SFD90686.1 two-component system, NtrC family, nitrogen regulation response regulator GlnG/two-component system, NtrC family, response regulator HydG [Chitinophaga sp. CF118]
MLDFKIFIVEDDKWYGGLLHHYLGQNPDYEVTLIESGKECLAQINRKPDLVTIDFGLPDMNGEELFKKIRQAQPNLPVIIISAQEKITTAVDLLKMGVEDYLVKDENTQQLLWNAVIRLREKQSLRHEISELKAELKTKYDYSRSIIGNSPALQGIFKLIDKAAGSLINVSISGETGTGKELVAKAVHYNSNRSSQPFIAVNMAAIPKDLVESELFGYEKGAFTGAQTRKSGRFEEANGGTLFLDEIGEMDPNIQSKLLRVLQEKELTRLGGVSKIKLDFRLVVATHKNMAEEVKKGNFREDLYYRIVGLPLTLPPLRERKEDILLLTQHFLTGYSKENGIHEIKLSPAAREKLLSYDYPGNIRELKSVVELAAVMSENNLIEPDDITFLSGNTNDVNAVLNAELTLREYTRLIIRNYLKRYDDNVLLVAEKLDIGKSTIYKMLQTGEIEGA